MDTLGIIYQEDFELVQQLLDQQTATLSQPTPSLVYIDRKGKNVETAITHLISGSFDQNDRRRFPNLRHIYVPFTGLNGLDLSILASMHVSVHNTSAHAPFIAERAMAFILALQGRLLTSHQRFSKNDWLRANGDYAEFWHSLSNKKVAIYGYGQIGQHLHDYVKPFRCQVGILSHKDRLYPDTQIFDSLNDLASWCDIFVVAVPLNDNTEGSINLSVLNKLKGKTLVNIARGPVINEDDLFKALSDIGLYGFASDVWYQYPTKEQPMMPPSKYDFTQFENVMITPHNAGGESRSLIVRYEDTVRQILASLALS